MPPAQLPVPPAVLQEILDSPAGQPPPGHVSDLHAVNPFHDFYIIAGPLILGIDGIFVVARLFTQYYLSKGLALEDYMISIAYVFQFAVIIVGLLVRHIIGHHIWDITIREAMELLKSINTISILYTIGIGMIKAAILLQYIRLFTSKHVNRPLRIACWICIAIGSIYYMIDMLASVMQCLPREKIWNPLYVGPGRCISIYAIWFSAGIFNTITDFVILVLPWPAILKLQMPTRRRLSIAAVFAMGSLACIASAIRTYYTWRTLNGSDYDNTYYMEFVGAWICFEMFIGICVFCAPAAPQFYVFVRGQWCRLGTVISSRSTSIASSSAAMMMGRSSTSEFSDLNSGEKDEDDECAGLAPTGPTRPSRVKQPSSRSPFANISLASFEQRDTVRGEGRPESKDIHVTRSVSQTVETIEQRGARRFCHGHLKC